MYTEPTNSINSALYTCRMCPYYLARDMKAEADVIFMPYNYILDIKVETCRSRNSPHSYTTLEGLRKEPYLNHASLNINSSLEPRPSSARFYLTEAFEAVRYNMDKEGLGLRLGK